MLVAGGGAANAVCLHRARAAGLGGFEFASAIPGTAGGGVRMNAGAYGRDWRDVLIDAVVVDADGPRTVDARRARALATATRRSRPGEVVAQVRFRLRAEHARRGEGAGGRAARAAQGDAADEQAHVRQRLQESRRASAGAGQADRGVRAEGPPRSAARSISPRHANFIENAGGATLRRLHRADGRGAAARARAVRRSSSSTRCSSSGRSSCPGCRGSPAARRSGPRGRPPEDVRSHRGTARAPRRARRSRGSRRRAVDPRSGSRCSRSRSAATSPRARPRSSRCRRSTSRGGTPAIRAQVRAALATELGQSLLRVDGDAIERRLGADPDRARRSATTARSRTRCASSSGPSGRCSCCARADRGVPRRGERAGAAPARAPAPLGPAAAVGDEGRARRRSGRRCRRRPPAAPRRRSRRCAARRFPAGVHSSRRRARR